jgi:hypothetical protein
MDDPAVRHALDSLEQAPDFLFDSVHQVKMPRWSKGMGATSALWVVPSWAGHCGRTRATWTRHLPRGSRGCARSSGTTEGATAGWRIDVQTSNIVANRQRTPGRSIE